MAAVAKNLFVFTLVLSPVSAEFVKNDESPGFLIDMDLREGRFPRPGAQNDALHYTLAFSHRAQTQELLTGTAPDGFCTLGYAHGASGMVLNSRALRSAHAGTVLVSTTMYAYLRIRATPSCAHGRVATDCSLWPEPVDARCNGAPTVILFEIETPRRL